MIPDVENGLWRRLGDYSAGDTSRVAENAPLERRTYHSSF